MIVIPFLAPPSSAGAAGSRDAWASRTPGTSRFITVIPGLPGQRKVHTQRQLSMSTISPYISPTKRQPRCRIVLKSIGLPGVMQWKSHATCTYLYSAGCRGEILITRCPSIGAIAAEQKKNNKWWRAAEQRTRDDLSTRAPCKLFWIRKPQCDFISIRA